MMRAHATLLVLLSIAVASASADEQRPTGDQAIAAAQAWLTAVKAKDEGELTKLTQLPFWQTGLGGNSKACRAKVADAAHLKPVLACILGEELLVSNVPQDWKHFAGTAQQVTPNTIQHPSLKKQKAKVAPLAATHSLVELEIDGEGVNYYLVFAIAMAGGSAKVSAVLADNETLE